MLPNTPTEEQNLAYRIPKFDSAHMRGEHKQLIKKGQRWPWVRIPTDMNCVGLKLLTRDEQGVAAFGIYILLVEAAANMHIRGVLADDRGAITLRRLSVLINVPLDVLERSVKLLLDPDIGWLDQVEIEVSGGEPAIKTDGRSDQTQTVADLIEPDGRSKVQTNPASGLSLVDPDEEEMKMKMKMKMRKEEEKEEDEEAHQAGSPGSTPKSRSGGLQAWLVQCSKLSGGASTSQWRSDKTSAERMYEELVWPDDVAPAVGRERLVDALKLAHKAASRQPKPMAWLTTTLKVEFSGEAVA